MDTPDEMAEVVAFPDRTVTKSSYFIVAEVVARDGQPFTTRVTFAEQPYDGDGDPGVQARWERPEWRDQVEAAFTEAMFAD